MHNFGKETRDALESVNLNRQSTEMVNSSKTNNHNYGKKALDRLIKLPEEKLALLSKERRDLVEYAKRNNQMMKLSPSQVDQFPPHQQQLIRHLRKKLGCPV